MANEMDERERQVEEVLRGVRPMGVQRGRDEMMFAAGRASAARARRVWPWQIGMATALAVSVGVLAVRPGKVTVERVVVHDVLPNEAVAASERPARMELQPPLPMDEREKGLGNGLGMDYWEMRNAVLSRGVDALVSPPTGGGAGTDAAEKTWKLEGSEGLPLWERRSL